MAAEVKGHDAKYEEALKKFEKNNPKYSFLLRRDVRVAELIGGSLSDLGDSISDMHFTGGSWNPKCRSSQHLMTK